MCDRALRGGVAQELVQPLDERVPRRQIGQVGGRARHRLDLVEIDGLEQVLAGREVPVERGGADLRAAGDVVERRGCAVLGEDLARGREQLLVVAAGVGALRAPRGQIGNGRCGRSRVADSWPLEKRRLSPYTNRRGSPTRSGGSLHFSADPLRSKGGSVSRVLCARQVRSAHPLRPARPREDAEHRRRPRDHPRLLPDDHPRRLGRDRRAAQDPGLARLLADQPLVGAERLHAELRRPAAARRARRRHPRPPPHARGRHRALHARVAGRRTGAVGRRGCSPRARCRASAPRSPRRRRSRC